ncbi:MAG: hypothetical protein HQK67_08040 [Desulfamplus sp.]|nr:hypothetical protein [Desulfamplus sp.]
MKKRILYGNANYEEIVSKNGYFVDKTKYNLKISQYVIYCFGNKGFRVFEV